jgi:diguanylate cyclase (GGDEF)-like protein
MNPALKERLGLRRRKPHTAEGRTDTAVMARALMYLFAATGAIVLASLALPGAVDDARIFATGASSLVLALVMLLGYDRLPQWSFQVFLAFATLLIEWAVWASGSITSPYVTLYFWIAIYAFYFFSRKQAALQVTFIVAAYAAMLALADDRSTAQIVQWAITSSALVVAGALIGVLKEHVDRLIARLADAARTDPLTSLLNRRGFHELFDTELERSRRNGNPLSVIVGDLDGFKAVNDRFGHHAGDSALEKVGQALKRAKRRIDTAARIGGEEFAIVVPETDANATYVLAERVRNEVRDAFQDDRMELTISLGVSTFPDHGGSAEGLMHAADQALYAAKKLGRNRSVIYNPEIPTKLYTGLDGLTSREAHLATVLSLAEVLDLRTSGAVGHAQTVGRYAEAIALELGESPEVAERLRFAGLVHDVGKIGISESILRNPGPLSDSDWSEMRRHPEIGARILDGANLDDLSSWVLAHHERPDGRGYPLGLSAGQIPLEGAILAVADAYEAMTTDRVYRSALTPADARAQLVHGSGTQFDERVVSAFLRVLDRGGDRLERSTTS